jgi:hypothetical protein
MRHGRGEPRRQAAESEHDELPRIDVVAGLCGVVLDDDDDDGHHGEQQR